MEIITIETGPIPTNGYLLIDKKNKKGLIIDTPMDSANLFLTNINEQDIQIDGILLTHSHWDHTADSHLLSNLTNAPVFIHANDEYRLVNPNKNTIWDLPYTLEPHKPEKYLENKQLISCGEILLEVRYVPGHTEGSVCFYEKNEKVIFTGDTLFNSSIGRTDLPGGSFELLINSINTQILNLSDEILIYPGHGHSSSVGNERRYNPFINQ